MVKLTREGIFLNFYNEIRKLEFVWESMFEMKAKIREE